MTLDDVIRHAREIGLIHKADDEQFLNQLERLASIAEAEGAIAERQKHHADIERWKAEAATAEKWRGLACSKDGGGQSVQRIQQEAAAVEREACAKVCDEQARTISTGYESSTAIRCARGIRARGQA